MSDSALFHWQNLPVSALNGDLAASWDALNTARGDLPFLAAYFIVAALKEFGSGQERLLVAHDAQGPAAMLILLRKRFFEWETFQPSQVSLGAWVARKGISLLEMARSVQHSLPKLCLILGVIQVDPLLAARDTDAEDSLSTNYIDTAWVEIEGNFSNYWNSRGKNLRHNLTKQRNKLTASGIATSMRCLTNTEEIADAVMRYGRLESSGWKGKQGTAIHCDNAQGRFYISVLENACRQNEGLVYEYLFNDQVVAMNLFLRRGATLVALKTTYDEKMKVFSPAFLLKQEELQQIFSGGIIQRMEFFGKVMDWHSRWTDKRRTLYHITVFRCKLLKKCIVNKIGNPPALPGRQ